MKILMLHSRYQQLGGEDIETECEVKLLRETGHEVVLIEFDNRLVEEIGRLRAAARSIWSVPAVRAVREQLHQGEFDLLHVQNYLPLVSPGVLRAGREFGVATVQSLHNYRLLCTNAKLFRDGQTCETCLNQPVPISGVLRGCYRNSRLASATIATMIGVHRAMGTWSRYTDALITVSDHVREKYIAGGFPEARLHVKPNVIFPPKAEGRLRDQFVVVGRLTREKGVETAIEAVRLAGEGVRLKIIGAGEDEARLRQRAEGLAGVAFTGALRPVEVETEIASSLALIMPASWDEPFGRTGVEAFAAETPVFGTRRGAIPELFGDTLPGALFDCGDTVELARLMRRAVDDRAWTASLRLAAGRRYADHFAPAAVLARTEGIYATAIARVRHGDRLTSAADRNKSRA